MGAFRAGTVFHGTVDQPTAQVIDGSLKFDKTAETYLTRTPGSAGNRKVWTLSYWIKFYGDIGAHLFSANNDAFQLELRSGGQLLFANSGSTSSNTLSTDLFRDYGQFYHVVIRHDAGNTEARFYINGKQNFTATLSNANGTWNNATSHNINGRSTSIDSFGSFGMSQVYFIDGLALGPGYFGFTDPLTNTWRPKKLRQGDPTVNDGTQWSSYITNSSGASNLFDGNLSTFYGPDGNTQTWTPPKPIEVISQVKIYYSSGSSSRNFEVNDNGNVVATGTGTKWVDLEFTGSLRKISGTNGWNVGAIEIDGVILVDSTTTTVDFGTNGFYLPMDNEDDFEKDKSGKGNDWTKNGFSGTFNDPDVIKNSPSGAVSGGRAQTGITTTSSAPANYATLNPLNTNSEFNSFSEGNLKVSGKTNNSYRSVFSTIGVSEGKFYFEVKPTEDGGNGMFIGIDRVANPSRYIGADNGNDGYAWKEEGGFRGNDGTIDASYGTAGYTDNDLIGVAVDLDGGNITYFKNGSNLGTANYSTSSRPPSIANATYYFGFSMYEASSAAEINFGQKPFKFPPPQGFLPLNSASARPETVITRPDQYVGVKTFSIPDDGSGGSVTLNNDFDMVWTKNRTNNSTNHVLQDSVRGYGDNKNLHPNLNVAQTSTNNITAVNGRTLTIGSNTNYYDDNVAWAWKAGGSKNTFNVDDVGYASFAASGITAGTVTPTGISAGTKQGFSIIKYDGAGTSTSDTPSQIPHGLLQAPSFFIVKAISGDNAADDWFCYHQSLGASKRIRLNKTNAADTQSNLWGNGTAPTSSVIYINKGWYSANYTGHTHILYAWHDVPGLQKFGSYSGSGEDSGTFIECGFKPAILWVKSDDTDSQEWIVYDSERGPINVINKYLEIQANTDEQTGRQVDFLSNGFKFRNGSSGATDNGSRTYIYCAWAEQPASNLYGGQSNAR